MSDNGQKRKRDVEDVGDRSDDSDSDDSDDEGPPQGCSWWCCRWWHDRRRRHEVDSTTDSSDDETASSTSAESEPDEDETFPLFIVDQEEFEVVNAIVHGFTEPEPRLPLELATRADFNAANRAVQNLRTQRANEQLAWYGNNANKRYRVEKAGTRRAEPRQSKEVTDRVKQAKKDGFKVRDASSSPIDDSWVSTMDDSSFVDEPTDDKGRKKRKRSEIGSTTLLGGKTDAFKRPRNTTPRDTHATGSEQPEPSIDASGKPNRMLPLIENTVNRTLPRPLRRSNNPLTAAVKNNAVKSGVRTPAAVAGPSTGLSTPAPRPQAVAPATLLKALKNLPPTRHDDREPSEDRPLTPTMRVVNERRRALKEQKERMSGFMTGIEPPEIFPSPNTPDADHTNEKRDLRTPEELQQSFDELRKSEQIAGWGIDREREQRHREEREQQQRARQATQQAGANRDGNKQNEIEDVVDLNSDQEEEVDESQNVQKRRRSSSRDDAPPTPKRQKDGRGKEKRDADAGKKDTSKGKPFVRNSPVGTRSRSPVKVYAPPPAPPTTSHPSATPFSVVPVRPAAVVATAREKSENLRAHERLLENAGRFMTEGTPLPDIRRGITKSVTSEIRSTSRSLTGAKPQQRAVSGNGRKPVQPGPKIPGEFPVESPPESPITEKPKPPKTVTKKIVTKRLDFGTKLSKAPVQPRRVKPLPVSVDDLKKSHGDERNWPDSRKTEVLAGILSPKARVHRPTGASQRPPMPRTPWKLPYPPNTKPTNVFDRSYTDGRAPRPGGPKLFQESVFDENGTEVGRPETSSTPAVVRTVDGAGNVPYPSLPDQVDALDTSETSDTSEVVEERRLLINAIIEDEFSRMKPGGTANEIKEQWDRAGRRVYNLIGAAGDRADNAWILDLRNRMDEDLTDEQKKVRDDAIMEEEREESLRLRASAAAYRQSVNNSTHHPSRQMGITTTSGAPSAPTLGESHEDDDLDEDNEFENWNGKKRIGKKHVQANDADENPNALLQSRLNHQNMLSRDFPDVTQRRTFTQNLHMFARQLRNTGDLVPDRFLDDMANYYPAEIAALRQPGPQATGEENDEHMSVVWRVALIAEGRPAARYLRGIHFGYYDCELWDSDSEDEGDPNERLLSEEDNDLPEDDFDEGGYGRGERVYDPDIDNRGDPSPPPANPGENDGYGSDDDDNDGPPEPPPGGSKIATNSGQTDAQRTRLSTDPRRTDQHQVAPSTHTSTGQTNRTSTAPLLFGREEVPAGYGGFGSTTTAPTGRKTSITSEAARKLIEEQEKARLRQAQQKGPDGKPKKTQPTTEKRKPANGGQKRSPATGAQNVGPKVPTGPKHTRKPKSDESKELGGLTGSGGNGQMGLTSPSGTLTGPSTGGAHIDTGGIADQTGAGREGGGWNVWTPTGSGRGRDDFGRRGRGVAPVGRGRGRGHLSPAPPASLDPYAEERLQREMQRQFERARRNQNNPYQSSTSPTTTSQPYITLQKKKQALKDMGVNLSGNDADTIERKWQNHGRPLPADTPGHSNQTEFPPSTEPIAERPVEQPTPQSNTPPGYTPARTMKDALKEAGLNYYGKDLPAIKAMYDKLLRDRDIPGRTPSTDSGARPGIPTGHLIQRQPTSSSTNRTDELPPRPGRTNTEQDFNSSEISHGSYSERLTSREEMMDYLDENRVSYDPKTANSRLSRLYQDTQRRLSQRNDRNESQGGTDHNLHGQSRPPIDQRTSGNNSTSTDRLGGSGAVAPPSMGPDEMMDYLDDQRVHYPRDSTPAVLWKIYQAVQNGGKFRKREGPPPRRKNGQSGGNPDREGSAYPAPTDTVLEDSLNAIIQGRDQRPPPTHRRNDDNDRHSRNSTPFGIDRRRRTDDDFGHGGGTWDDYQSGDDRRNSFDRRNGQGYHTPDGRDRSEGGRNQRGGYQGSGDRGGNYQGREPRGGGGYQGSGDRGGGYQGREPRGSGYQGSGGHYTDQSSHGNNSTNQKPVRDTYTPSHRGGHQEGGYRGRGNRGGRNSGGPNRGGWLQGRDSGRNSPFVDNEGDTSMDSPGPNSRTPSQAPREPRNNQYRNDNQNQDDQYWQDSNNQGGTSRARRDNSGGSGYSGSSGWKKSAKQFDPREPQTPAPPPRQPRGVWTRDSPYQLRSRAHGNNGGDGFEGNYNTNGGRRGGRGGNINGQWQRGGIPGNHQTPHTDSEGDFSMDSIESESPERGRGLLVSYDGVFDVSDFLDDTFTSPVRNTGTGSSNVLIDTSSSPPSSVALIDDPISHDPIASPIRSLSVGLKDREIPRFFEEPLSPKTIPSSSPPLPRPIDINLFNENTSLKAKHAATPAIPVPDKSSSRKSKRTWTSPYRGRGTPKRHRRKSHGEEDFVTSPLESVFSMSNKRTIFYKRRNDSPSSPPISSRTRLRFRDAEKGNVDGLALSSPSPISARTRARFRDVRRDGEDEVALRDTPKVRRKLDFGKEVGNSIENGGRG
ncbi:hypothetical protein Vi05172_g12453 [Venturia inaequalis]|nr:hypothetical protein Vi05172_g12453 [Venturia inaequalis]